ncbi:MAG TPA: flagellar biosynthesis anti-sigma factor FlgM [Acidobacteriota bacterium]|nr:flagellar biosynthesis anti-sigma factor FlgM [Acidobacteriota bacterium]
MEINGNNPLMIVNKNVQRIEHVPGPDKGREEGAVNSSPADRLELSVRGREFAHFADLIKSTPDIRESKVEQVRKELERGTYNVKAERIAEIIIKGNLLDEIL